MAAVALTEIPAISRLSPTVIRLLGMNPSPKTLRGTNCYLIGTGKQRLLIDTGEIGKPEFVANLRRTLTTENASVNQILITHWHPDHIGGLPDILQVFQASKPSEDVTVLKHRRSSPALDEEEAEAAFGEGSSRCFRYVEDGDLLETEGAVLRAFFTPGHADDHLMLWNARERILFSADCVLGEGSAVFEDYTLYMKSLARIRDFLQQFENDSPVIYPGHGPVVPNGIAKVGEYIHHREERERQYLTALNQVYPRAMEVEEITSEVYVGLPASLFDAAVGNVWLQLKKLQSEGKVRVDQDGKWTLSDTSRNSRL